MTQMQEPIRVPWWSDMVMYWLEDQVAIAFHTDIPIHSDLPPAVQKEKIINSLRLDDLNQFLNARGFKLMSFIESDVPRVSGQGKQEISGGETSNMSHRETSDVSQEATGIIPLTSPTGKYLFPSPSDEGTIAVCFFNVGSMPMVHSMQ